MPSPFADIAGRKKPTGQIDIAVIQSLSRLEDPGQLLDQYGQIIIDECHHVSAISFESILKQARAKFVVGLTATPMRRDGHQPIIFMQCGPTRHSAIKYGGEAEGAANSGYPAGFDNSGCVPHPRQ